MVGFAAEYAEGAWLHPYRVVGLVKFGRVTTGNPEGF